MQLPNIELNQVDGPHRPTASQIWDMLKQFPPFIEIRAIGINGQTGTVCFETYHEELQQVVVFDLEARTRK